MGKTHNKTAAGLFPLLLLIAFGLPAPVRAELANADLRGLRVHTVDGVLRLKEDQIDLGTAALVISRDWGTTKTLHTYRRKIDIIAEEIQRRLEAKKIPANFLAIPEINKYLFDELGFKTLTTADDPEDLFLHVVLDKKRGYCLSLSVLYLAIGERLGMPLYGVVVPGHFFVRYDDGQYRYNIETTAQGALADEDHYLRSFAPPAGHKLYMKNLNKRQTLGCFFNNLGNSYSAVGDKEKAFLELSRAVQINPTLAEAHTNLGNIYLSKGQVSAAIRHYNEALKILPKDPRTLNNLGNAYMEEDRYQQAQNAYLRALDQDPGFLDAHRNLAQAWRRQGLLEKAVAQIRAAITLEPHNPENYLHIGRFYLEMDDPQAAQENLLKALLYAPSMTAARVELGNAYLAMNRNDWALEEFTAAAAAGDAYEAHACFGMARCFHQQKQYDREILAYQRVLLIEPDNVPALQNLGNALLETGQFEQAADVYQQAIQISPQSGLYYNLAVAYVKQDNYEQALTYYLDALKMQPDYAAAHHGLAVCYYYLKNKELSLKHARMAQSLGWDVPRELLK